MHVVIVSLGQNDCEVVARHLGPNHLDTLQSQHPVALTLNSGTNVCNLDFALSERRNCYDFGSLDAATGLQLHSLIAAVCTHPVPAPVL